MTTDDDSSPLPDKDDVVVIVIDGTLDLHAFSPKDLKTLVPDYLAECQARGILEVRLIHGKGQGAVRASVQALLKRSPLVKSFQSAANNWGATVVTLAPVPAEPGVSR